MRIILFIRFILLDGCFFNVHHHLLPFIFEQNQYSLKVPIFKLINYCLLNFERSISLGIFFKV